MMKSKNSQSSQFAGAKQASKEKVTGGLVFEKVWGQLKDK